MFLIGWLEIWEAFRLFFYIGHPVVPGKVSIELVATVLSALDPFLNKSVLLYFAYNLLAFPESREGCFGNNGVDFTYAP